MHNIEKIENFERIADIKANITVKLGSTKISIKDLMKLTPGTVVTLHSDANEPLTFYIHDKPIGLCEIVTTGDKDNPKFGMRIVELFHLSKNKMKL